MGFLYLSIHISPSSLHPSTYPSVQRHLHALRAHDFSSNVLNLAPLLLLLVLFLFRRVQMKVQVEATADTTGGKHGKRSNTLTRLSSSRSQSPLLESELLSSSSSSSELLARTVLSGWGTSSSTESLGIREGTRDHSLRWSTTTTKQRNTYFWRKGAECVNAAATKIHPSVSRKSG